MDLSMDNENRLTLPFASRQSCSRGWAREKLLRFERHHDPGRRGSNAWLEFAKICLSRYRAAGFL